MFVSVMDAIRCPFYLLVDVARVLKIITSTTTEKLTSLYIFLVNEKKAHTYTWSSMHYYWPLYGSTYWLVNIFPNWMGLKL